MNNSDIADQLRLYADLSELHGGNPFKIKSYSIAAFRIDKLPEVLAEKDLAQLEQIEGIGKSVATKIHELNTTGSFTELETLKQQTPAGVMDLFRVKGIGPKKITYIWHELGIESIGELLYACKENRLAKAKGFGLKTQDSIRKNIEFILASADKFHYAHLERTALQLIDVLKQNPLVSQVSTCGPLRRKCEILDRIDLLLASKTTEKLVESLKGLTFLHEAKTEGNSITAKINGMIPIQIQVVEDAAFAYQLFLQTGSEEHLAHLGEIENQIITQEAEIYTSNGMDYIEPELREGRNEVEKARLHTLPKLIELKDLKGSLHNHSTWSDGLNTLEEMAVHCRSLGYTYLGICDHSKSAFYANGLKEDRILQQHHEIDMLNKKLEPFRIFKGIESDILYDGQLDYEPAVLKSFDFIVASVHSNLKMTEEKAMERLMGAIENPYTTILGHPTGRLLLMREGYPIDHRRIIDACAAHGVVLELNANPYRLDIDWRWIDYALNKGVRISINPDAHEKEGFNDMYYGTCVARKGGLTREMCFNSLSMDEMADYFAKRKAEIQ
ncbi:MAG: DNA polymerase/3'-5' exonuclease PolX [Bacteroidia bacterium]|jgi:DNA polymerase (family 10)